jgi:hypothetical protein
MKSDPGILRAGDQNHLSGLRCGCGCQNRRTLSSKSVPAGNSHTVCPAWAGNVFAARRRTWCTVAKQEIPGVFVALCGSTQMSRMRLDVSRRRADGDEAGRRNRIRQRHVGDERERTVRQEPAVRRHCRAYTRKPARCRSRGSSPSARMRPMRPVTAACGARSNACSGRNLSSSAGPSRKDGGRTSAPCSSPITIRMESWSMPAAPAPASTTPSLNGYGGACNRSQRTECRSMSRRRAAAGSGRRPCLAAYIGCGPNSSSQLDSKVRRQRRRRNVLGFEQATEATKQVAIILQGLGFIVPG